MSFLNFFDRNALKIQITFGEFEREITCYEETARTCNITISLSNPQDLIRHLERKYSDFRELKEKCFTEVTFSQKSRVLSMNEAENYMFDKIKMIKTNHKF
ncbi:MAG: hypothetical protein Q8M08_02705 [Bacteroidales bacterium]|nr:hypothetical protein [Bacteroidales bacterium]